MNICNTYTVKPRIAQYAGGQMICSDVRIFRICEPVQRNAYELVVAIYFNNTYKIIGHNPWKNKS